MAKTAAKAAPKGPGFADLLASLRPDALASLPPLFLIHGEEGYYADRLAEAFDALIPEADRDFNLLTLYAPQTTMATVHEACRRFPMMADRQVVVLKECQSCQARELEKLLPYLREPSPHTLLALIFRGEKAKGRDLAATVRAAGGVVFEGTPLKEWQAAPIISSMVKQAGLNIEQKGLDMLADHLGTDLSRIHNELEKLRVALPAGAMVTPEAVERHVGVSREFNNYELTAALAARDAAKALRIVNHFAANARQYPFPVTIAVLFTLFSNVLIWHFTPDKSPSSIAGATGVRFPAAQNELALAARNYNARQALDIIGALRRTDARSKGVGSRQDPYDLMRDLLFAILHA